MAGGGQAAIAPSAAVSLRHLQAACRVHPRTAVCHPGADAVLLLGLTDEPRLQLRHIPSSTHQLTSTQASPALPTVCVEAWNTVEWKSALFCSHTPSGGRMGSRWRRAALCSSAEAWGSLTGRTTARTGTLSGVCTGCSRWLCSRNRSPSASPWCAFSPPAPAVRAAGEDWWGPALSRRVPLS